MALNQFLNQAARYGKGECYNMVGMGKEYSGRYWIDSRTEDTFYKLYENAVAKNMPVCLAEIPLSQSVLRLDVDISIKLQFLIDGENVEKVMDENLCYTMEQVISLIKLGNGLLKKMLIGANNEDLSCFLLEKSAKIIGNDVDDNGTHNTRIKRGFHLHWPLVVTNTFEQKNWINKLVTGCVAERIFDFDKCPIDPLSSDVSWLMYGSRKPTETTIRGTMNYEPYKITHAFDFDGETIDIDELFQKVHLVDPYDDSQTINASNIRKMTIRPCGRKTLVFAACDDSWSIPRPVSIKTVETPNAPTNMNHIEQLLNMLSNERCVDYLQWFNVGRCLFSCTLGTWEGLDLWSRWSMNCPEKFVESVCQLKWNSFSITPFGIGVLKNWAKTDNQIEYTKWRNEVFSESLDGFTRNTSGEIAQLAANIMADYFKYIFKYSNGSWYEFVTHWKTHNESASCDIPLLTVLNRKIKPFVEDILKKIPVSKETKAKIEIYESVVKKLDEPSSLKSIIQMLQIEYHDASFYDTLNTNYALIGLKNGVYDLNKCEFRQGRPEDNISSSLNCDYVEYDMAGEEIVQLERHLQRFFPNPARRTYMLDVLCQIFVGNMYLKNLFFWVGKGDNGKTAFSRMIEEMLGPDYCVKLPTTLLSGVKGDAGKASPELCMLIGKRIAFFDEPDHSETLSNGMLKILTGHDTLQPRELFQKGKEVKKFVNRAMFVMLCNKEPNVKDAEDGAMWARFRVCEFESKFVKESEAPDTWEEQLLAKKFPVDYNFVNDVKNIKGPFCFYLLQHWKRTRNQDLDTPQCIVDSTHNYKSNNDWLCKFVKTELISDELHVIDLLAFKEKYSTFLSLQNYKIMATSTYKLIEDLKKLGIDVSNDGIVGYNFAC